jgi:hypothetical protein
MNPEKPSEAINFSQSIGREIDEMVAIDQEMRLQDDLNTNWDESIDINNTNRMKEIVTTFGWPTLTQVGETTAYNAWLLVQHADHEVAFQTHCLDLMKHLPENEVDLTNIAYLEDRVRVNSNQGQLYGTQFRQVNDEHVPCAIEDEENVDTRRSEIGLGPLREQIDKMYERYPFPEKEDKTL